eukprot:scaffold81330_cov19-Prasinocladus_malaysianus.AAC.1
MPATLAGFTQELAHRLIAACNTSGVSPSRLNSFCPARAFSGYKKCTGCPCDADDCDGFAGLLGAWTLDALLVAPPWS